MLKIRKEVDGQNRFVPGGQAKHKAPKDDCTGIQGKMHDVHKPQKNMSQGNRNVPKKRSLNKRINSNGNYCDRPWLGQPRRGRNPRYDSDDASFGDDFMEKIDPSEDYRSVPLDVERRLIE